MHHKDVPGSGGHGSRQGTTTLNKHLKTLQANVERSHMTRDGGVPAAIPGDGDGWPSMYDLAKSMTDGKWGNSPSAKGKGK
jgi:hypothetical protein